MDKVRSMCFTWTLRNDVLRLVCKINHLMYDVAILDKNGKETASCLIPSSESKCVSHLPNGQITQDLETNTTFLTLSHVNQDNYYNGYWTCRHGRGKELQIAEVTLIFNECMYTSVTCLYT